MSTNEKPVRVQGGYTYRGRFIERSTWTYWAGKRRSSRRRARGLVHKTVWKVDGAPGVFQMLRDAAAWIEKQS